MYNTPIIKIYTSITDNLILTINTLTNNQTIHDVKKWVSQELGISILLQDLLNLNYLDKLITTDNNIILTTLINTNGIIELYLEIKQLTDKQVLLYFKEVNNLNNLNWDKDTDLTSWNVITSINDRITEIRLGCNNIIYIPKEIDNLTQLNRLDLYNNKLTCIHKEIGNLTQLTELYLGSNLLTSIPNEIGKLTQLNRLDLYNNKLTSIPKEIGNLTQLSELYLCTN